MIKGMIYIEYELLFKSHDLERLIKTLFLKRLPISNLFGCASD